MKIVYFYQFFSTPKGSWGTRVYEFARRWVEQGHDVTVVTSIFYKSDMEAEGLVSEQYFEGIRVKVLNIHLSNKHSFFKRVFTFLQYALMSSWYAIRLPADIVVASSGPITAGIPGLVARYLRGRKLAFEVRDLWPAGAIEMGLLKNKLLQKMTYWFEKRCYRAASLIVGLSPGMCEDISKRYGYSHLLSVPNAADNELFGAHKTWTPPDWVAGRKVALYAGNIGATNNSVLLLKTARLLQEKGRNDILILLIGDGQQRQMLEEQSKQEGLDHFKILGLIPKTELVSWVQHALCSVIPLKGSPVLDTSSPNKLFEAMAAGTPVAQTTRGWIHELITDADCGYTVSPETPDELAAALMELADDPSRRERMGEAGRNLAKTQFDKIILADSMLNGLESVHQAKGRGPVSQ